MRSTATTAVLLAALLTTPAAAQIVQGRVIESGSRTPVLGADVSMLDATGATTGRATTDATGGFVLSVPVGPSFRLQVRHIGYRAYTSEVLDRPGTDVRVEIRLGVDAIALDPLTVTAPRSVLDRHLADFEARRTSNATIGGHFITRREIEARPVASASELTLGVPGVQVRQLSETFDDRSFIFLGGNGGACLANVYVDGMRLVQSEHKTVDDVLMTSNIAGIEVYPRALTAPMQFQADPGCGVVLYWTARDASTNWSAKRIAVGGGILAGLVLGGLMLIS